MSSDLASWLREKSPELQVEVIRRAPNMLPEEEEVGAFLAILAEAADERIGGRVRLMQGWANDSIGSDHIFANDWLTVLRTIKESLADALTVNFSDSDALAYYREFDRILMYAVIEATRLASDTDRVELLENMVEIRERMAELDRSKASFLKVAAHELRTPLTILEGYTAMMRSLAQQDVNLRSLLDGFESGIRRLREVIADMIQVTLIDADAIDIAYQPVYLQKLFNVIIDNLGKDFENRQVILKVEPLVIQEPIYADPERLYQVLEKIIGNSLKYTPNGGQVMVGSHLSRPTERGDGISGYITLEIEDTGIGIDPRNLERIFEVFSGIGDFTTHSTGKTKFKGGGAGLGLPIARGIVEAHGGRIWAESPGFDEDACPGSIFYIELPVRTYPPSDGD